MLCARPDDMQPATQRSSRDVLKLGRYIVRCLTAQPDIWLLFLYKCGQLVAVNLHEPVARSVGILDELFQAQQGFPPEPDQLQRERREPRDRERAVRPVTIGSLPSSPRSPTDGRLSNRALCVASSSSSSSSSSSASPDSVSPASVSSLSPDNDQFRGMDEDDTDDGYSESDDEPFAYMTGRRFSRTPSTGEPRSRRSSSGCGSSYNSGGSCYNSGANSPWSSVTGRRRNSCTDIAEVADDTGSCRDTLSVNSYGMPQSGSTVSQRENSSFLPVTQPASAPTSPVGSPVSQLLSDLSNITLDPNWQAIKSTVRERNAAMFNNDLMADIYFVVGNPGHTQRIPSHKYILATGSSVFYAMFYGGLADTKEEIEVPDVEPTAFLTLLRYLYCDEIQLEPDTVLATLYVAKKYIVPHLARACVNYLETSLTAKNACLLLSQSRLFEEPELMQRCWEVIDAQAEIALHSDGFVDIDADTLQSVLGRETINCKETILWEAAMNWASAECSRREIEPTPSNKRQVLDSALYLLRLPAMSLEEFANGPAQMGMLTLEETVDLFLHYTASNKPRLTYPTKPRIGLKPQTCHRFQSCAYRSNQWRYRGRCDSIQFSVDRRVFIVGFGLYGSSTGASDYTVKIELKRLGRILAENNTKFFSDGSSNTFHVYFAHPVQVDPELFYTASAILDGAELSYFGQEGLSEINAGCVTFQFQCSSESTNGTGVQGGQIPELIFYGPISENH
ncbi:BTB/POZ domain-containing protein 6 isoform X1 [Acyrthosiphon pisum]|uniref:BTB domain-containing protein n=1 Tax=Acyrthosiphon pisum TaxID=7029 RepID=A0A8R2HB05_ACYPI|nr:BTB/POZ domain-containing protein 6 isoform X1 [Acyrthosiphon pisum]|eukprot:XP_016663637.1 PREDICTED: BTB/POZ domain-containing protein 6 isoform X1 [Acyrthosiphon pisum]